MNHNIQEWLPLPSGISVSPHHSFTEELLKQFDNLILSNQNNRPISQSITDISLNSSRHSSVSMGSKSSSSSSIKLETQGNRHNNTRSAAKNLLRKSSLYLRTKFHDHRPWRGKTKPNESPISPPIITQYPPKPLHYSPVEPLPPETNSDMSHHARLHRVSLPLLKFTTVQHTQRRRRSDSDDFLQQPTTLSSQPPKVQSTFTSLLSKKWNQLICKKKK